jgi:hypothetical protein
VSADARPDPGLLAEYAEGLLAGTPEGDAIEARLASDERWAAAYAEVTAALVAVRDDLATLPVAEPLPPDVTTRLEAALEREARTVVPLRPRRRRFLAVASGVAAAAVAVVVGGIAVTGVVQAPNADESTTVSASSEGPEPVGPMTAPGPLPTELAGVRVTSTGTDYAEPHRAGLPAAAPERNTAPIPVGLGRLTSPAALTQCLEAVRTVTGSPVRSADFARWRGEPAVIVSAGRVLAVGPSCGLSGADVVGRVPGTP